MKKQTLLSIVLATAALSVLTAGPVQSSKDVIPVQTVPTESPWSFSLAPNGWMTSINGTISAGDRSADFDVSFKDVLKHLDMGFMMSAEIRYKRWSLLGDILYARLHDDIEPPDGILFSSTHEVLKETIGSLALAYRVVDKKPAYLDLFAGVRGYDFNTQIVLRPRLAQGVDATSSLSWADPIFGLHGRCYVSRAWFLNLYGDIGGFGVGSDLTWQALGSVGVEVSHWCDLQFGYRALYFDYESGGTREKITTHGPVIGAILHF